MRILLAHNSLYFPSQGGGDISNRLLMEALAERGHDVRAVARIERFGEAGHLEQLAAFEKRGIFNTHVTDGAIRVNLHGVDVHTVTLDPQFRSYFARQIEAFDPDVILASTDDPAQLLLDPALQAPRAHTVFLARATIALPFGPDSSGPSPAKAARLRETDAQVGVSEYVARYMRDHGGLDAVHVPISLLPKGEHPFLGGFENRFVTMVNPCAVKGIDIFLALTDRMQHLSFAAVPTWGANEDDLANLRKRPNITVLDPADNIDEILRQTRVMLVPSLWAEARSRIVVEAMSRGVPVIASNAGGIPEAKLGVDYLLSVNLLKGYRPALDSRMVPVADVPPQNIDPWVAALSRLTTDRAHYDSLALQSRQAALSYLENLSAAPFEQLLQKTVAAPRKPRLSPEKRKLLALRLRAKSKCEHQLFCFPYAGAGTLWCRGWGEVCPVLLPGRETRQAEPPIEDMDALVRWLAPQLPDRPLIFFGHSMGAGIAFELTRKLRREGARLPLALIVSGAKAPHGRIPQPDPSDEEILADLSRLGPVPDDPAWMRLVFPALRADVRMYRAWRPAPEEPLNIPIYAYCGDSDPNLQPYDMELWRRETTGPFRLRIFPGGHFYFQDDPAPLLAALKEDQAEVTGLSNSGSSS